MSITIETLKSMKYNPCSVRGGTEPVRMNDGRTVYIKPSRWGGNGLSWGFTFSPCGKYIQVGFFDGWELRDIETYLCP